MGRVRAGQTKVQQVAELREDPLQIVEYRLHGYRCSVCGEVVWAVRPGIVKGQLFGPRLQALIAYMKGSLHAGYTGLADFCGEVRQTERCCGACRCTSEAREELSAAHRFLLVPGSNFGLGSVGMGALTDLRQARRRWCRARVFSGAVSARFLASPMSSLRL